MPEYSLLRGSADVVSPLLKYQIQGGPKKPDHFLKCITLLYNDLGRQSIHQNVQLFIRSKSDILSAAVFKYSLHKVRKTTLH